MKTFLVALIVSAIGLASLAAVPAEAAKAKKHKKAGAVHRMVPRAAVAPRSQFQGGVLAGPLYNGQDYLGTDPDPGIRAYLLRDLDSRYGGGD